MEFSLPPDAQRRLLRLPEVENIVNMKRSWLYAEIASGRFPQPLKIGRASRWDSRAVDEYVASVVKRQNGEDNNGLA